MLRSCRQTLGPSLTGLRPLSFGQSSFEVYHGVIFSQSANMHMVNDVATFFIYMDTTEAPKIKFNLLFLSKICKRFKFSDWSSKKMKPVTLSKYSKCSQYVTIIYIYIFIYSRPRVLFVILYFEKCITQFDDLNSEVSAVSTQA